MDAGTVLEKAIQKEAEARDLYRQTGERAENPAVKTLMADLARQEATHKQMLESLPEDQAAALVPVGDKPDLKISDHLESKHLSPDSSLQDALTFAMQREEAARNFYSTMAESVDSGELKALMEKLAGMERTHKTRLEELYEDIFLREM
jgi:rubrerythrin